MSYESGKDSALIVIDVQKDFCYGGSLPVPNGDKVVPVLNKYIQKFKEANVPIYVTRDWHPPNHISFKPQSGPWPPHCVQNTEGAEFHNDLKLPKKTVTVSKATDPNKEAYSGFDETNLEEELRQNDVRRVFVGGLATDYCIKNTVLDAMELGFETTLLEDAIQGANVKSGDSEKAIEEMKAKGAYIASYSNLMSLKIDFNVTGRIELKPIGFVKKKATSKSIKDEGNISEIILNKGLIEAVNGIEDFSHLFIIFWMHKILNMKRNTIKVHPRGRKDVPLSGIFATRTPYRPNPIGLTLVELLKVDRNVLTVRGLDAMDGTPILDIKPFDYWDTAQDVRVPEWWKTLENERI